MRARKGAFIVCLAFAALPAGGCAKKADTPNYSKMGYTLEALCSRYAHEMLNVDYAYVPEDMVEDVENQCMAVTKTYSKIPGVEEKMGRYVMLIMNTCDGALGRAWMQC